MSQQQPEMIRKQVSELEREQLDWVVGKQLGYDVALTDAEDDTTRQCFFWSPVWADNSRDYKVHCQGDVWSPSTRWAHGGPIIDREVMMVDGDIARAPHVKWRAVTTSTIKDSWGLTQRVSANGSTALIAAMRAFVASRLGDEVEVPV